MICAVGRIVLVSCAVWAAVDAASPPAGAHNNNNGAVDDALQEALQTMMNGLAEQTGFAIQLGWKSSSMEFSLAAGEYTVPGSSTPKKVTTSDTFLFGSGTKPFTSSAILTMVGQGKLTLDDPANKYIDPVLDSLKPGTSLVGLFGPDAAKITVGHVLRMQSGVQDFDQPDFDQQILKAGSKMHSPLEFVENAANQTVKLLFEPGTQVAYSSTNYDLAGFILLSQAKSGTTWETIDYPSFFPAGVLGNLKFFTTQKIDSWLTVPGVTGGGWGHLPKVTIYNQSSTILGWTCGNMVGTTGDVANFLWKLLGPEASILPAAQLEEMKMFKPLSVGWAAGDISYGTGLMIETSTRNAPRPPTWTELGTYMGHGGDTYGFLSEQGIAYGLNASISVISNQDGDGAFVEMTLMCKTIETAAKILTGSTTDLNCMTPMELAALQP